MLAAADYRHVTTVNQSSRAIDAFEKLEPDLILLDLHMPPPDGFAVMHAVREQVSADDFLPILVLSADASHEAKQRALANGATDFVAKPLQLAEVFLQHLVRHGGARLGTCGVLDHFLRVRRATARVLLALEREDIGDELRGRLLTQRAVAAHVRRAAMRGAIDEVDVVPGSQEVIEPAVAAIIVGRRDRRRLGAPSGLLHHPACWMIFSCAAPSWPSRCSGWPSCRCGWR